jgi:hypothetical protein
MIKDSIYSISFPATWRRRTTETTPGHETELPAARSLCRTTYLQGCRDQLVGKWLWTVARGSGAPLHRNKRSGIFAFITESPRECNARWAHATLNG